MVLLWALWDSLHSFFSKWVNTLLSKPCGAFSYLFSRKSHHLPYSLVNPLTSSIKVSTPKTYFSIWSRYLTKSGRWKSFWNSSNLALRSLALSLWNRNLLGYNHVPSLVLLNTSDIPVPLRAINIAIWSSNTRTIVNCSILQSYSKRFLQWYRSNRLKTNSKKITHVILRRRKRVVKNTLVYLSKVISFNSQMKPSR